MTLTFRVSRSHNLNV